MFTFRYKHIAIGAYLYMLIPITIFMWGWLNIAAFVWCASCLWGGFYYLVKKNYLPDTTELNLSMRQLLLPSIVIVLWVVESGIGGLTYQHWDLHWRNALFRDLVNFSWPVIYPDTGNALVYYFTYWMVPALAGKIAGWKAARATLELWTMLGILICYLLLLVYYQKKYNKALSFKQQIVILLVFMGWSGADFIGAIVLNSIDKFNIGLSGLFGWPDSIGGFQYTSFFAEVAWVFNQTIVPWIVVCLFLEKKHEYGLYIFLGMCVLPFAPIPFVGLFILMVGTFLIQHFEKERRKNLLGNIKSVFSQANILALLSVLPVFYLFFTMNTAASGADGTGGFGIYKPLAEDFSKYFPWMLFFVFVEVGIYALLIGKEQRRQPMFWLVLASLAVIPVFRIGTGRDFCMRASIPAFFVLMTFVADWFLQSFYKHQVRGLCLLVIFSSTFISSVIFDSAFTFKQVYLNGFKAVYAEDIYTMSDEQIIGKAGAIDWLNFLVEQPLDKNFFLYVGKKKSERNITCDNEWMLHYRKENNLFLHSGSYKISPFNYENKSLYFHEEEQSAALIDDSYFLCIESARDAYHFIDVNSRMLLDLPGNNAYDLARAQAYRRIDSPGFFGPAQRWKIHKLSNGYAILHDQWALTYNAKDNMVYLTEFTGASNQSWKFDRVK